jgi:hypothetical protein
MNGKKKNVRVKKCIGLLTLTNGLVYVSEQLCIAINIIYEE